MKRNVNVYVCGPTVYDFIHVGNSRSIIVFDLLHRVLKYQCQNVNFIQNITDIDDKIIARAEKENSTPKAIAEKYTDAFLEDIAKLNVLNCIRPKATDHMEDMINYIKKIEKYTYATTDGLYINTNLIPYNLFEHRMEEKSRIQEENKLNSKDFALWKFKEDYFWLSPWGKGRPGWHLECSVMSEKYLPLTIHGGGIDLKFPHHENEMAQCWAHNNYYPAKIWMHNDMLLFHGEKMSKSIGNVKYLRDIVKNSLDGDWFKIFFSFLSL